MKVKLLGDHSDYHCGSDAVWKVLRETVLRNGCEVVNGSNFDALIVNGEGSMHHGRPTFHKKMKALEAALSSGKRAYLVNSVWDSNPNQYDDVLSALSGISVREAASAEDLLERHGLHAEVCLDFSYYSEVCDALGSSEGSDVEFVTDYLDPAIANFTSMPEKYLNGRKAFVLADLNWPSAVSQLSNGVLLVTGRHHAVYAACKAKTPFAAIEGNSHKISGLLKTFGSTIPVASQIDQLADVIDWCKNNRREFDHLFERMDDMSEKVKPEDVLPKA